MILPDVNVLIYAFRGDSEHHAISKKWLDAVVAEDVQFGISPLALSAVVRIATNPRIFKRPSATREVFAYCDSLLSQPHCTIVEPGDRHWQIFGRLCLDTSTRGPRVTDAWFAALAIEQGCTWITFDRDYARFPGLAWQEPQINA
jgi:toxin-antitoxin system PIN domain toxin